MYCIITSKILVYMGELEIMRAEQSRVLGSYGQPYHNYNDSTPHSTPQAESLDIGRGSGRATLASKGV